MKKERLRKIHDTLAEIGIGILILFIIGFALIAGWMMMYSMSLP